jgi:SAM-dependent methyltransferase
MATNLGHPSAVSQAAYAEEARLAARQDLYCRYAVPSVDLPGWVLGHVRWAGDETVVDVGCGNGVYLERLAELYPDTRRVGVDRSWSMLVGLRRRAREVRAADPPVVQADLAHLPLARGSVDVVLANHVLYHLGDISAGLAELRQALAPAGTVIATTKGSRHLGALDALVAEAAGAAHSLRPLGWAARFDVERGRAALGATFGHVMVDLLEQDLVVPGPDPLLSYLEAAAPLVRAALQADWERLLAEVRTRIEAIIASDGAFSDRSLVVLFACRR